LNMFEIIK